MVIGIGIGVAVAIGAYIIGRLIGAGGSPSTATPGPNNAGADCPTACDQWALRRGERCSAEKDQAAAQASVDNARAAYLSVQASAVAAAAAAAAVAAIPIVGQVAAIALLVVAAALQVYAAYLLGVLGSAEVDLANKTKAAQAARTAENQALDILNKNCSGEEKARCLALPSPC